MSCSKSGGRFPVAMPKPLLARADFLVKLAGTWGARGEDQDVTTAAALLKALTPASPT